MISTLKKIDKQALLEIQEEKTVRKTEELFVLFPLGSQFDHLIKQSLEKLGVFCLVADSSRIKAADIDQLQPRGIILSGGPVSIYSDPPPFDSAIFELGIPVFGICLGFQLWAHHIGCPITKAEKKEFGTHQLNLVADSPLFKGCDELMPVLESHGDRIEKGDDPEFRILAGTDNAPVAAARWKHLYGVQFHPEVTETVFGSQIFENFCFEICQAKDRYPAKEMARQKIDALRQKLGNRKALLAISGGSDSATVAYLLKEALGGQSGRLKGIYIRGIDRPDDEAYVTKYFGNQEWIELKIVDATYRFLEFLKGKYAMPEKRVAMRGVYKGILEEEAKAFGASFIVQGTLYTDISESGQGYDVRAQKSQIKLHHNVNLSFSLEEITPLDDCVKDSGRNIGRTIGVPEDLLVRHPFPGPGLVVRIEGEVTAKKLEIARHIDDIYIGELRKHNLYHQVWQAGAVVTQSVTTCTKGDGAASGVIVALWAVWSVNGFTAQAAELPWDFIKLVSQKITNEVLEVGAVVYRVSDKPPATIEWG